jgi:hypothetical protein
MGWKSASSLHFATRNQNEIITWKIFRNNPYIGKMRKIFCNPPFRFSRYYGQIRNAAAFVPLVTQMRDGLLFA